MTAVSETHLDTRAFDEYTGQLAEKLGIEMRHIIRIEAAAVVKIVASNSRGPKASKVRKQATERAMRSTSQAGYKLTINVGRRGLPAGTMWLREGVSGKFFIVGSYKWKGATFDHDGWHLKRQRWAAVRDLWRVKRKTTRDAVKAALASRGSEGRSWLQVIQSMGFSHDEVPPASARIPAHLERAIPRDGKLRQNGFADEIIQSGRYGIMILNRSPLAYKNGGVRKLNYAINRRSAAFKNANRAGMFNTANSLAKFYPGFRVTG